MPSKQKDPSAKRTALKSTAAKAKLSKAVAVPARTTVLVLGMHRSGTSALSGVLAKLGCDLPATEMPAANSNEKGFFESGRIYEMHEELLASLGIEWSDWQPLHAGWFRSHRAAEFHGRALGALEAEFGNSRLFVLKDPRICRLLPLWTGVLKDFGCDLAIVHIHRNPLDVAASLEKRNRIPVAEGMLIWLRHVIDAEAASRGRARCFTSYPRMLANWPRETAKIEDQLGLVLPRRSLATTRAVNEFLTRDLQHFAHAPDDLIENPMIAGWIRDIYAILERWARTGEEAKDHATFDQVNQAFTVTSPVFGPMLETSEDRAYKDQIRRKLHDAEETVKQIKTERDAARETFQRPLDEAEAALEQIREELAEARARLSQTQNALQHRDDEIKSKSREIEAFHDQMQRRSDDLAKMARLLSEMETRNLDSQKQTHKILETLRCNHIRAEEHNVALKKQLETSTSETIAERQRRKRLELALAEIKRSTSWRISAPLRRLIHLLRRG